MEAYRAARAPPPPPAASAELAPAAAYLLSDDARNVSGTTLYVDAGYHAMGM
jgi:enoyl-[acyl-carrier protein] reductase I